MLTPDLDALVPMLCVTLAALVSMLAEAFRDRDERMPMAMWGLIGLAGSVVSSVLLWNRSAVGFGVIVADNFSRDGVRRNAQWLKANHGDRVRIDLRNGTANILISSEELAERRAALQKRGGYPYPESQTPWQEIQRNIVDQLADGMVLKPAVKYQRVAQKAGVPRNSH